MATVSIRKMSAAVDAEARQAWADRIQRDFEGQPGVVPAVALLNQHKEDCSVDTNFRAAVIEALTLAGLSAATFGEGDSEEIVCLRAGFHVGGTARVVTVALIGRSDLDEPVRQAERDGLLQQARPALTEKGWTVRVNDFGHLTVIDPPHASKEG